MQISMGDDDSAGDTTINEDNLKSQILKYDFKIIKALPYQQCTKDDIVARIATPAQEADDLAAHVYGIVNEWYDWKIVTTPLAALRNGSAQALANVVPRLASLPVQASECGIIPDVIDSLVARAQNQIIRIRDEFEDLKDRLDYWQEEGEDPNDHEFYADVLRTLTNGVWLVSYFLLLLLLLLCGDCIVIFVVLFFFNSVQASDLIVPIANRITP